MSTLNNVSELASWEHSDLVAALQRASAREALLEQQVADLLATNSERHEHLTRILATHAQQLQLYETSIETTHRQAQELTTLTNIIREATARSSEALAHASAPSFCKQEYQLLVRQSSLSHDTPAVSDGTTHIVHNALPSTSSCLVGGDGSVTSQTKLPIASNSTDEKTTSSLHRTLSEAESTACTEEHPGSDTTACSASQHTARDSQQSTCISEYTPPACTAPSHLPHTTTAATASQPADPASFAPATADVSPETASCVTSGSKLASAPVSLTSAYVQIPGTSSPQVAASTASVTAASSGTSTQCAPAPEALLATKTETVRTVKTLA